MDAVFRLFLWRMRQVDQQLDWLQCILDFMVTMIVRSLVSDRIEWAVYLV
jgi:hypothetical protein